MQRPTHGDGISSEDERAPVDREPPSPPSPETRAASLPATRDTIDEASRESFPASDPPAWSAMRVGPPRT